MKLILVLCVFAGMAGAQSPVTLRIDAQTPGIAIPSDFAGLSFETSNIVPEKDGTYLFSAENKRLIALFRAIGIKNLRVGGGTADIPEYALPRPADVDRLFAFAQAANVKVIYTFRLLNGDKTNAAEIGRYIQRHYKPLLSCFEIGNEPDWHSFHTSPGHVRDPKIVETTPGVPGTAYPSFIADWKDFAATVRKAVPDARFTGPDTGSNYPVPGAKDTDYEGESWTHHFARDTKGSGVAFVAHHDYVGQGAKGVSIETAINDMLSTDWPATHYTLLYDHVLAPALTEGLSYRMTECNDYTGGVNGASNAFASALWALDYMHWHAAHHAAGVNFHNKRWIYTDTIYLDSSGTFQINPKAYAIKAFDLGSQGNVVPLTISNPESVNLSGYAVRGAKELFVTIINKEHGSGAREAKVAIVAPGISGRAAGMFLTAPNGDVGARTGVTLGGAAMEDGTWAGKWTELSLSKGGKAEVKVPASSAAVLRFSLN